MGIPNQLFFNHLLVSVTDAGLFSKASFLLWVSSICVSSHGDLQAPLVLYLVFSLEGTLAYLTEAIKVKLSF